MPVGKVRFYDAEKGFGFLTKDEGGDVYVRATALPPGVTTLKAGQKVEFGVVEGRKGEQALSVHVLEAPPLASSPPALRSPDQRALARKSFNASATALPCSCAVCLPSSVFWICSGQNWF